VGTDTTKKRFAEREEEMRAADPMSWVELPVDYARQLIEEAADLTRLAGSILAAGYATWEHLIARPAAPPAQPLVYREISGFEARLHPTLQNESELLFDEPEVEPWFFMPEPMRKWVQQLAEPASARAILMPESEESRLERILREAVKEVMTPRVVHGLRRRLEETAYIFLRTDRRVAARRAVAAAVTIEDERPLQPPHPFLKALVARSLRVALTVQRARAEPARLALAP
jgi:hypothetical protein